MISWRRALPIVAFTLLEACATGPSSTLQVKTNSAVVANVAAHRTYAHAVATTPAGYSEGRLTPETLAMARTRVDENLDAKGYVLAPTEEEADMIVRLSSGIRLRVQEPTGASANAGAPTETDIVGKLVVDLFDRKTGGQLFHGYARDEIHRDDVDGKKLGTAVRLILEPIPAAR